MCSWLVTVEPQLQTVNVLIVGEVFCNSLENSLESARLARIYLSEGFGNCFWNPQDKENQKIKLRAWPEPCYTVQNFQSIETFLTLKLSKHIKRGSCQQQLMQTRKHPVFVLDCLNSPSCAGALFKELGHWFCCQNLGLFDWNDCLLE